MAGELSAEQRQACLETLSADRLRALLEDLGVQAEDRRSRAAMSQALAHAPFPDVLAGLRVPELKAFCSTLGVYDKGKKPELIARLLDVRGARTPRKSSDRPDAGDTAAGLKSALRRFTLDAAAGFRGRDAETQFVKALLAAFGWPDGEPPGADIPASVSVLEHGTRADRRVAALWNERRVLIEVLPIDAALGPAWGDLARICLQLTPSPQFVVLTNQRDLQLYDLARDRAAPRLTIPIDGLPKQSDAFPFLAKDWVPGATPKIVGDKVSREVADLVAKVFRNLRARFPKREDDVIKFTLQCIVTMFAEDIGLLPPDHFTAVLYEGARHNDVEERLRELFALMSKRDVPAPRKVAFFNGGLFSNPVTLPLDRAELAALTKAAEANWRYVDPHIFGSVFQGIMNDAERHASGAHYTAHEDIMRVVGPTIVEPWLRRIDDARTLEDLNEIRKGLSKFRVLDPACGSGNFLYVAFRELHGLETQLLARMHRDFPSAQMLGWGSGISTTNFYGIDTNRFAVELAKVTLNIAKKIAFEDRRQNAAASWAQSELDIDPSLPLDNLDQNILCGDALFTDWPLVDAVVGNPPILGDKKIRAELGREYLQRLRENSGLDGVVDISCHWFRRAHDRLAQGGRAGLVATSGIRVGKQRASTLDYIVGNTGTITNAVSSILWPGEAALDVSMVNWVKGDAPGPYELWVDGVLYRLSHIPTHLQLHADASEAEAIRANDGGTTVGVSFHHESFRSSGPRGFSVAELSGLACVRPVATGDDMLRGRLALSPDYCVHLGDYATESAARAAGGRAFEHLKKYVYPHVKERAESGKETDDFAHWLRSWWAPQKPRRDFFGKVAQKTRLIACSKVQARPVFTFLSTGFVPNDTLQLFGFDDDYTFGILQSNAHWAWTRAKGGKVRQDIRYTADVWSTFPWPQEISEESVVAVARAAQNIRATRYRLMLDNHWSLRELHRAAEVDGAHPLKNAQRALDEAVTGAYGMPSDQEVTEFLLDLNRCLAEDEAHGRVVAGPGLPSGLDPKDPRWFSEDCIEPPAPPS